MRAERIARVALGALVAGLVVAGLVSVGGPGAARTERQDDTRLDDLQRLASYVRCVADTQDRTLPGALRPVETCEGGQRFEDPYTGAPYRYEKVTDTAFRLCAGFGNAARLNAIRAAEIDPATGCLQVTYTPS
jgi:hypothetical protein